MRPGQSLTATGDISSFIHVKTHKLLQVYNKLLQICSQAVDIFKMCSHCLFPVVVKSLEQAVNNLEQARWQTCYKVVLTSLIQW